MGKLIDVDQIDWQKGVFVDPNTDEPLPIIHKIATIEMLRDWQQEVKAIPLSRIKQLRVDALKYRDDEANDFVDFEVGAINGVIHMIDKLIKESEDK